MSESSLKQHYDSMYIQAIDLISQGKESYDSILQENNTETDHRYGLTLILRPPSSLFPSIQSFLQELQSIEPHQYYYPNEDLHMTGLSIIPSHVGFSLDQLDLTKYQQIITNCLTKEPLIPPIHIHLKGITASSSCIMIQGFVEHDALNIFREKLRELFRLSDLQQDVDGRYRLTTAHLTVVRFKQPLQDPTALIQILHKYREIDFGKFQVKELELVGNDWYLLSSKVQLIHRFLLSDLF